MLLNKNFFLLLVLICVGINNLNAAVTPEDAAAAVQETIVLLQGFSDQITVRLQQLADYTATFDVASLDGMANIKVFKSKAKLTGIEGLVR